MFYGNFLVSHLPLAHVLRAQPESDNTSLVNGVLRSLVYIIDTLAVVAATVVGLLPSPAWCKVQMFALVLKNDRRMCC